MILKRITSAGLAHYSYFVGAKNSAAVIDPRRDCRTYLDLAEQYYLKINCIFETHRNEDFVTGSLELNKLTGAEIYHGPGVDWGFGNTLRDNQGIEFDNVKLTCIHTPGHTDESMSIGLTDLDSGARTLIFTGDTLFVGEVGRTDLYGTREVSRMASNLFNSIFTRLLPLGDEVIICPAHGSDSICGGNIGNREESTLGIERHYNPVLQKSREEFIQYKLVENLERPPYFRQMEKYNLIGPPLLADLSKPKPMTAAEVLCEVGKGAVIVDTREAVSFAGAHIKNSYSIWLDGLPAFTGWMLNIEQPIILILEDVIFLAKAVSYLARIGYDKIIGYLMNGIESWYGRGFPTESFSLLTVHALKNKIDFGEKLTLVDVRGQSEWKAGYIEQAIHVYVGDLQGQLSEVPRDKPVAVICSIGNRSSLGASILQRAAYENVYSVAGGMTGWVNAGFPVKV